MIQEFDLSPPFNYYKRVTSPFIASKRIEIRNSLKSKEMAELLMSYVTGDKLRLTKKVKVAHRNLALYHLFTPSGIHLSSILIFIFPFLYLIKKKSKLAHAAVITAVCLLPFLLFSKFYSIKRMSILRLLNFYGSKVSDRIPIFAIFILTFIIDFFFGTYDQSPLSFMYSFLFLGIILSTTHKPKSYLMFALLGGQVIIAYFQLRTLTTTGFIFGFFLTGLFGLIFPLIFMFFWSSPIFGTTFLEILITSYWKLISFCSIQTERFGHYYSSLPIVLIFIIFSLKLKNKWKVPIFLFLLLIHSGPVLNLPRGAFLHSKVAQTKRFWKFKKSDKLLKQKRTRRGYKILLASGKTCRIKIFDNFYEGRCAAKSQKKARKQNADPLGL
ncbi:MAG: hypothetical protein ISR65_01840 [Bacteriovoracaceae bacterium]|nr:hypothetical protein [Bacteriovoracaceae bacterium]